MRSNMPTQEVSIAEDIVVQKQNNITRGRLDTRVSCSGRSTVELFDYLEPAGGLQSTYTLRGSIFGPVNYDYYFPQMGREVLIKDTFQHSSHERAAIIRRNNY